ncbi:nuclear transport factor 2 family protein [Candidatus Binatia bacterium]|nr:nuclear transport factor 2 family protein [Candidatus Binatia bacterium]
MPSLEERIASLETRLDAAESTLAIERLKAEYAARVDSRHAHISAGAPDPAHVSEMAARVAELFTEDAVWDGGRSLGVARGRAAIQDRLANPTVRWAWHFFLKPRIRVRGDFAEGTWDLFSPCTLQDGSQRWMVGVENDTYHRVDGVWLHASMQLETVILASFEKGWSGGVSQ